MVQPRRHKRSLDRMVMPEGLTETFLEKIKELRPAVKTDHLKTEITSKFVSSDTAPPQLRMDRAIDKWLTTEQQNEQTNIRLLETHEEFNILPRVTYVRFVEFCRDLIVQIIGETPPLDAIIGSFSGGASTSRKRTHGHPSLKYLGKAHATSRCMDLFEDCIKEEIPIWLGEGVDLISIEVVPGNVMFTVPKKTDIDRVSCKEPDLNMFVQKGIGNFLRRRLLSRAGISLNDQSKNRKLARIGSIDGSLATLDLSSASDSVTTALVAEMLPVCWYTLLDSVRSPVTLVRGEEHVNEMFSSMGNGYTFELESLLFYVITRATVYFEGIKGIVSIYGDDIICPTPVVRELTWTLKYFGFTVNLEKSFYEGPFRESCGGHYWDGIDITPFYLKRPIKTLPDLMHMANQLRHWARIPGTDVLDPEVEEIWYWLKSLVPKSLWGGVDTSFKYQLVSDDKPKYRLHEETESRETGIGGYLHWLNTTWDRNGPILEGVETSERSIGIKQFRYKKVANKRPWLGLDGLWISEINARP
jgi:hypothetical protein